MCDNVWSQTLRDYIDTDRDRIKSNGSTAKHNLTKHFCLHEETFINTFLWIP